jgi:hypothetical protein
MSAEKIAEEPGKNIFVGFLESWTLGLQNETKRV